MLKVKIDACINLKLEIGDTAKGHPSNACRLVGLNHAFDGFQPRLIEVRMIHELVQSTC